MDDKIKIQELRGSWQIPGIDNTKLTDEEFIEKMKRGFYYKPSKEDYLKFRRVLQKS